MIGAEKMRGMDTPEIEFLGLRFAQMDETKALSWLMERAKGPDYFYIVTPNVDHVVQIHGDPECLDHVYTDADLRLCDSRIISLMGRFNGLKLPVVTGSGLTARLLSKPLPEKTKIAMIGGNQYQREWLARTQPHVELCYHEPPFGLRTNLEAQTAAAIFVEQAKADIILITVGAPQSELIASLIQSRGVARGVALCVGASLEFITGEKRRAPVWMQKLCLEWAFRLGSEPRRLARRYLVDGPRIFSIWMDWMKGRGGKRAPVPGTQGLFGGASVVPIAAKRDEVASDLALEKPLTDVITPDLTPVPQYKMATVAVRTDGQRKAG